MIFEGLKIVSVLWQVRISTVSLVLLNPFSHRRRDVSHVYFT